MLINIPLLSYMLASGDEPRESEPRSSDGKDTRAITPLSKFSRHSNLRPLSITDLTCISLSTRWVFRGARTPTSGLTETIPSMNSRP
ncbi:hypothetical protein TNCV_4059731 [Trichonephila clavipes]|nr:hypothetical protein TNCV_4059731 [Trichonephila clavipes]